jgi:DnaK suppressor protein
MTKKDLNVFRRILEGRETELAGRNYSRGALAIQRSSDELDRIQESQERELALGDLDRNSVFMREVRDALSRLDAGTFGICVECQANINPKRLAAVPWALTGIVCQEAADRQQKTPWQENELPLLVAA